jgi:hypothetical protein
MLLYGVKFAYKMLKVSESTKYANAFPINKSRERENFLLDFHKKKTRRSGNKSSYVKL